ncbi:hypothetical protein DFS33DRAFT_889061 [Desarmillaria ectypa]|nr:hypothetical protein DFS33DRAFT_889061 [Desarmillaria ectypa]
MSRLRSVIGSLAFLHHTKNVVSSISASLTPSQTVVGYIFSAPKGNITERPRTLEEIKKYAQTMVTWEPIPRSVFELLDMLKEVEDTMIYSHLPFSGASCIRYEKAVNLPANWIAIGDSVMKLNPLFGQGVVKALLGAICLNTLLQKCYTISTIPKDFSTKFFEMQKNKISHLWDADKYWVYIMGTTPLFLYMGDII